ncbi:MAG: immunoglobulin domain-containing protein [Verrucomicrobia bacterium]|nr:immunoglobulin domain-containing protein [Verrucomicrobiota bacterium]
MPVALRADVRPVPLVSSQVETTPYRFTGLIIANADRFGSGAVIGHPNIVLSCAHVPYDADFDLNPWLGPVYWIWKPHGSDFQNWPTAKKFRGYAKFSGYQFISETSTVDHPGKRIFDFVAYYAFENLAAGAYGGAWTNGVAVLNTLAPKMATGYPSGLYAEGHPDAYKMHVTGPFYTPLGVGQGPSMIVDGVASGSGNSGGPLWVQDSVSGAWLAAGVVITKANKLEGASINGLGVRALDADAWSLITEALGAAPPPNDNFAGKISLAGIPISVTGSNLGAGKESGEPDHAEQVGGKSIWWTWTAPASQRVTIDTVGSSFDTVLAVYTGSTLSNLNPVESHFGNLEHNWSRVTFSASSGTTYHIVVDAYASVGGDVVLNILAPPLNDDFLWRIPLAGSEARVTGSNVGAGKQNGEPQHAGEPGGYSVWWTWTPTVAGTVTIDTQGSEIDTLLAVYTGESVSTLVPVASNNDGDFRITSLLSFVAEAGRAYHIAVDGVEGETGSIVLNLRQGLHFRRQPDSETAAVGATAFLGVTAGGSANLRYQWRKNGLDLPGATNSFLSITNIQNTHAGAYNVMISGTNGTALSDSAALKVIPQYIFTTLAGTPRSGSTDGKGAAAGFFGPSGTARDAAGNLYLADSGNNTIRKITPDGVVSTIAGSPGVKGNVNGIGNAARFDVPLGVAVDPGGNVYVADFYNHQIRKIALDGTVTSLAGSTRKTAGSNDASGSLARFYGPSSVALDDAGNLYVADTYNHTIRKITPQAAVSTLAGKAGIRGSFDGSGSVARFAFPRGVAVDTSGNIYVADSGNATIRRITSDGIVSTIAGSAGITGTVDAFGQGALFINPHGIAVNSSGVLYVADSSAHTIRRIPTSPTRNVLFNSSTLAGIPTKSGHMDGPVETATFNIPTGIAVDNTGAVYVAETGNHTIRVISPSDVVSTLAGRSGTGSADGPGSTALFASLDGMAVDSSDNVYVADVANHTIRKITPDGGVSTLAGMPENAGSADGLGRDARFNHPESPAVDKAGSVYVADAWNHTIRKITPNGLVSTLAGKAGMHGSTDGPGSSARFFYPFAVALDSAGVIYVADGYNHTIRKITPDGLVSTLAGTAGVYGHTDGFGKGTRFSGPEGLAVDAAANVYVADFGNHVIRKIRPDGLVTTFAGIAREAGGWDGIGTEAALDSPTGIAVDNEGNLYVSDSGNNSIRMITPAGVVSTLAGSLWDDPGNKDGSASEARFSSPYGLVVDRKGNVYVSDSGNNIVRKGSPQLVAKKAQTIDFAVLSSRTFGDLPFSVAASASSGLAVQLTVVSGPAAISGNTVTLTGAGTVTIRAAQTGNAEFGAAAEAERSFQVAKARQTITFEPISDKLLSSPPFGLVASASSGLPVSFSVVSGPAALSGITLTLSAAGVVTVRASQAGDLNYEAAPSVERTFTVASNSRPPTARLSTLPSIIVASATPLEVLITYSDDAAIKSATLDSKDIRVTGPNGYNQLAVFDYVDIGGDGTPRTAAYHIDAPGGLWSSTANGSYTVRMEPEQVSDIGNETVAATVLGSFEVMIPAPPTLAPPAITKQPQSQTVTVGANVIFTVATSGSEPLAFQWHWNGAPIPGATASDLVLRNVQQSDAGNYSVSVSNAVKSVTSEPASLKVNPVIAAPTITEPPRDQMVNVGETVKFSVTATGTAPLAYAWQFNGSTLSGEITHTLTLTNVQTSNAGNYTVAVTNEGGQALSAPAKLTVLDPPPIVKRPPNDDFRNRILLSGPMILADGSNFDASQETGEPNHAGKPATKSIWWSWTPVHSGVVTISTANSAIDTLLGVYTGTVVTNLVAVASNDDDPQGGSTSLVSFQAQAGTQYHIVVDAFGGEAGVIKLKILLETPKPSLRVEVSGRNLVLSWPTNHVGFVVEATDSLTSAVWTEVRITTATIGDTFSAKIPIQADLKFYRLREQ